MKYSLCAILLAVIPINLNAASTDELWDERYGNPGVQGYSVSAIAIVEDDVYVGGTFLSVGGFVATNIAKWDGESWNGVGSGLGTGLNHGVGSFVTCGGVLYAGGLFTNAGTVSALNVAGWDGANWCSLGSGISGIVQVLASDGSNVYFGGSFTNAGGTTASNVAQWDGGQFTGVGGNPSTNIALWHIPHSLSISQAV